MQVVIRTGGAEYEVSCDLTEGTGTVGDLAGSWGLGHVAAIAVDGRRVGRTTPLTESGLGDRVLKLV